jgi:hypothetical protein
MGGKEGVLPKILEEKIKEKATREERRKELETLAKRLYQDAYVILENFGEMREITIGAPNWIVSDDSRVEQGVRWETPVVRVEKDDHVFEISVKTEDWELGRVLFLSEVIGIEKVLVLSGVVKERERMPKGAKIFVSTLTSEKERKWLHEESDLELTCGGDCAIITGVWGKDKRVPTVEELKGYQELCEFLGGKLAESKVGGSAVG